MDNVDNIDEHVRAEYVSTHSYFDSILSRVNTRTNSNDNVEFPELGKTLRVNRNISSSNSSTETDLLSKHWGDNWKVDGIQEFEDQVFIDAGDIVGKSKMSMTEVVPFLVPTSDPVRVIIGDKDIDNVSELSEKMSIGCSDTSSSESADEDEDDVIDASMTSLKPTSVARSSSGLKLVTTPGDMLVKKGTTVTMTCFVEGSKPIDVCWFHGDQRMTESKHCILSRSGNYHNIIIFNIRMEDRGLYSLAAVNYQGELWHSWHLDVEGIS